MLSFRRLLPLALVALMIGPRLAGAAEEQPAAVASAPVVLAGFATAYRGGQPVGSVRRGAACEQIERREWTELLRRRIAIELKAAFDSEVAGRADRLGVRLEHPLQVNAVLQRLELQLCQHASSAWTGAITLRIGWEVRATHDPVVLLSTSTTGSFSARERQHGHTAIGIRHALRMSVDQLLDDVQFSALLGASR